MSTPRQFRLLALAGVLASLSVVAAGEDGALAPPGVDFREIVRAAKAQVFPAVVFIKCVSENLEEGRRTNMAVSGSGVIISPGGEVLTNWHVVDKAISVRCLLSDGQALRAQVLGTDKDTDLALLQLQAAGEALDLPFAAFGESSLLQEGDFVMAMGAPWGLSRSVSIGIVSCTRRFLEGASEYSLWLQTDASISPGNSGGPLVDTSGRIIGINARGIMAGGDLGFAIPSETVLFLLPQLREHGEMRWSWTGLELQPLRDFERDVYFEGSTGVIVADVDADSPAHQAGIQPRDRILTVDGEPLDGRTEEDLPAARRRLGTLPVDEPATLVVLRDGSRMTVELTPREKGQVEGEELDCPRWDLTVKSINQFDNPDLYFHRKKGVFVFGIKQPGNAAQAGLAPRDILLRVDSRPIETLDDVRSAHRDALADLENRSKVVCTVLRRGLMRQVVLDFSRDFTKE